MTPDRLINLLNRTDLGPLWKALRPEADFYAKKIAALQELLGGPQNPVRVVEGWGHHWIECDFFTGPVVLDWNAYAYKQRLKQHSEEPFRCALFNEVLAPSPKGEKILVFQKKLWRGSLLDHQAYATKQRQIPWPWSVTLPAPLERGSLWL